VENWSAMVNDQGDSCEKYSRSADGQIRKAPGLIIGLPGNARLLVFPHSGTKFLCGDADLKLLGAIDRFLSPAEHMRSVLQEFPSLWDRAPAELLTRLEEFQRVGALISTIDVLRVCAVYVPEAPARVGWITIPTNGRSSEVCRAIASYGENARCFQREYSFFVADQTEDSSTRDAIRGMTASISGSVVYAGPGEVSEFAVRLAKHSGAPCEVVKAALLGFGDGAITPGANRNLILLQTAGSLFVTVDDDTLCNTAIARSPGGGGLAVGGHEDPYRIIQFQDRPSALDSLHFEPRDWVADHERILGRSPSSIVSEFGAEQIPDMDTMCSHIHEALITGVGRVAMTYNGSVGDSGMQVIPPFLIAPDKRPPGTQISDSREIIRATDRYCISHGRGAAQTMFAGLDNRDILPPFFPAYRNEDGLFAVLVSLCVRGAFWGHVPLIMQHLPQVSRHCESASVGRLRVSDWLLAACSLWNPGAAMATKHRLKALGWHLEALGALPEKEFVMTMTPPLFGRLSALLTYATESFGGNKCPPDWWVREVNNYLSQHVSVALSPDYLTPGDIELSTVSNAINHLRHMMRQYGLILQWWPEIVEAAKDLASRGVRSGVEIRGC
jgi:hypothetical protein